MWRANSLEETLMMQRIEGRRKRGWQRVRWLDSIADSMGTNLRTPWEIVEDRRAWPAAVHMVTESQTQLSYWKTMAPRVACKDFLEPGRDINWCYSQLTSGYGLGSWKGSTRLIFQCGSLAWESLWMQPFSLIQPCPFVIQAECLPFISYLSYKENHKSLSDSSKCTTSSQTPLPLVFFVFNEIHYI